MKLTIDITDEQLARIDRLLIQPLIEPLTREEEWVDSPPALPPANLKRGDMRRRCIPKGTK